MTWSIPEETLYVSVVLFESEQSCKILMFQFRLIKDEKNSTIAHVFYLIFVTILRKYTAILST